MALGVKNLPASAGDIKRRGFDPRVGKILWRRKWQPTPVFLPGESPWTEEPGGLQSIALQSLTRLSGLAHTHQVTAGSTQLALGPYSERLELPITATGAPRPVGDTEGRSPLSRSPRRIVPAIRTNWKVWSPSALGRLTGRGPVPAMSLALNR